jgi:hypothetical protein
MSKKPKVKWFSKPQEQDYTAAKSYLILLFDEQTASNHCEALKQAPIFRASELPLLGANNSHVKEDQTDCRWEEAFCSSSRPRQERRKAPYC